MKKADQWSGLVLLILSGLICWGSLFLPYGNIRNPGPGFFPLWLGIILGAMSIGLIWKTARQKEGARTLREILAEKVRWDKVLWTLIALVLYAALMDFLGFLIATLLFMAFLLRVIEPQPWRTVFMWTLIGSLGSYLIFEMWMKLRLPKGFWGI
jgi:putative tricarboxylic transport membrane protein